MIDINIYSNSLRFRDGIWYSPVHHGGSISYPSEGNKICFEIEDNSFWFNYRNRIICEVIKKYSTNAPLFDVGGGNGFVADYLIKNGIDTILVEPRIDGCINGKGRGLKFIINSFFDTDHFLKDRIPNIGIFDVLEHIKNTDEFLYALQTLLIQGGRLYITLPAFNSLWSEEDKYAGHYRRYKINELQQILSRHRFEILFSSYFFSFLFFPVFIFRAIPSKFGLYKPDMQKSKDQHSSNATTTKILNIMMNIELRKIKRSESVMFGSSLLIVAKKR